LARWCSAAAARSWATRRTARTPARRSSSAACAGARSSVLLAWLYRVSTNLCLDRLRGQRDALHTPLADDIPGLESGNGESRLLDRDSVRRLLGAVEERTREVVVYLYIDGMTQEEVARVSGMTDRSVRNHVARLRDAAVRLGLLGEAS
jgi:RNA polymerase sigma-70 factor (ECF subfamily)